MGNGELLRPIQIFYELRRYLATYFNQTFLFARETGKMDE